ncbi:MAG TPA: N-acetylmuramoyl-L-alanine amidase [Candidatus Paceibacterota bacterium]
MRKIILSIFIVAVLYTFWFVGSYPKGFYYIDTTYNYVGSNIEKGLSYIAYVGSNLAAIILHKPVTVAELHTKYTDTATKKVRVFIVPGHEPDYGGTEYGDLKERDMTVELANYLGEFLKNNGHYDVMLARDKNNWSPTLLSYFNDHWNEIIAFAKDSRKETLQLVNTGEMKKTIATVYHNNARPDVALRLYGINKWGNENAIDIAIHIHFNDYPRKNASVPGKYSGIAIYVPENQYLNSATTKALVETVFKRLSKYNAVSNLPSEGDGVIEEPDLIAIGVNNTADAASMLIEYGYIYEPQFVNPNVRQSILKDLAFQTYLGLQDFFGAGNDVSFAYDTLMLPHSWTDNLTKNQADTDDVLALQSALLLDGLYPSGGRTKNDCPRTGKIGPCTLGAISAFQKKYGIKGEEGFVGEKTKKVLNENYSVKII